MAVWIALLAAMVLLAGRLPGQAPSSLPSWPPPTPGANAGPGSSAVPSKSPSGATLLSAPEAASVWRHVSGQAAGQDSLEHARSLVQAGDFGAAGREVTALLAAEPASADALFLLGYVQFRERKPAESLKSYTAGAAIRRPSPDDLVVVASDYVQLKDNADAARWLTVATEEAPANATAWYLLGRVRYLQDRAAESLAAFQHCLDVRPRDLRAKYNQGLALERLERTEEAAAAYRTAIAWAEASGSRDPQPYLDLGTLLLTQGKITDRLPCCSKRRSGVQATHCASSS